MIFLIIPAVIIPCLIVGCAVFIFCCSMRPLRRYALSASLWCVALSPWTLAVIFGTIAFLIFFGLAREAASYALMHFIPLQIPGWSTATARIAGYLLIAAALTGSLATATLAARLHEVVIHRLTLALFRLYVAAVSCGVGILTSFFIFSYLSFSRFQTAYALMVGCSLGLFASPALSAFCYKSAAQFRGKYPVRFPFVTEQEFASTNPQS